MAANARVVGLLVSTPALGSILSGVLAASPALRVRAFDNVQALLTYARIAPVDLFVLDFDGTDSPAAMVAGALRDDGAVVRRPFEVIALSGTALPEVKLAAVEAGIDEVIIKPMSPRYLLERVLARTQRQQSAEAPARGRPYADKASRHGSNVVPLFDRPVQPLH